MPKSILKFQLTEAIIEMVKAGLGVTAMSKWLAGPYLKSSQIIAMPITENGLFRNWRAATLKTDSSSTRMMDFIGLIQTQTRMDSI